MCLIIERACRSSRNKLIAITSPTDLQRNRREHYLQVVTIYKRALTGINVVTTDLKKKKKRSILGRESLPRPIFMRQYRTSVRHGVINEKYCSRADKYIRPLVVFVTKIVRVNENEEKKKIQTIFCIYLQHFFYAR